MSYTAEPEQSDKNRESFTKPNPKLVFASLFDGEKPPTIDTIVSVFNTTDYPDTTAWQLMHDNSLFMIKGFAKAVMGRETIFSSMVVPGDKAAEVPIEKRDGTVVKRIEFMSDFTEALRYAEDMNQTIPMNADVSTSAAFSTPVPHYFQQIEPEKAALWNSVFAIVHFMYHIKGHKIGEFFARE